MCIRDSSSSGGDSVYRLSAIPCVSFRSISFTIISTSGKCQHPDMATFTVRNIHFTRLPDVCITRPVTDLTFILWTVEHESSKFEGQPSPNFLCFCDQMRTEVTNWQVINCKQFLEGNKIKYTLVTLDLKANNPHSQIVFLVIFRIVFIRLCHIKKDGIYSFRAKRGRKNEVLNFFKIYE